MPGGNVKMSVSGVSQFRSQMNQAKTAVNALNSQLKLSETQFRASGDAETYMAEQSKLLEKQITEQSKVVEAAKSALDHLARTAGTDSAEYNKMAGTLANAQTALVEMQSKLQGMSGANAATALGKVGTAANDTKGKLTDAKTEAGNLQTTLGNIDKNVSFNALIGGIEKIEKTAVNAIKQIGKIAKAVWDAEVDASTWADDLITEAIQNGMTTTELQQWRYAAQFVDTEAETILQARKKIVDDINAARGGTARDMTLYYGGSVEKTVVDENVRGVDGKTYKAVQTTDTRKKLQIPIYEKGSDVPRSMNDIFFDTVRAISEISDEVERNAAAMEVFGKSYTELGTLMQPGADEAWFSNMDEALQYVVSEEKVEALGAFNDEWNRLNSGIKATKLSTMAALAPAFTEIAAAFTDIVSQVNDWANSADGQKALSDLASGVSSVITELSVDKVSSTVNTITDSIGKFTGTLEWFMNNSGDVIGAIEGIGIVLAGLKIGKGALQALQIYNAVKGLRPGGSTPATGGAPSSNGTPVTNAEPAAGKGIEAKSLIDKVALAAFDLAPAVAVAPIYASVAELIRKENEEAIGTFLADTIEANKSFLGINFAAIAKIAKSDWENLTYYLTGRRVGPARSTKQQEEAEKLDQMYADNPSGVFVYNTKTGETRAIDDTTKPPSGSFGNAYTYKKDLTGNSLDELQQAFARSMEETTKPKIAGMSELETYFGSAEGITAEGAALVELVEQGIASGEPAIEAEGADIAESAAAGIESGIPAVSAAVARMTAAIAAAAAATAVYSAPPRTPSRTYNASSTFYAETVNMSGGASGAEVAQLMAEANKRVYMGYGGK